MTRFPVDGTGRLSSEREHPTADLVGPAGGDLTGSYPNPTVASTVVSGAAGSPAKGNAAHADGAGAWHWRRERINVLDYGAVPDNSTDFAPAFDAACAAAVYNLSALASGIATALLPAGLAAEVYIPAGVYYSSRTLIPPTGVRVVCEHGAGWTAGTIIRFPAGVRGVFLPWDTTDGVTSNAASSWAEWVGGALVASNGSRLVAADFDNSSHGIQISGTQDQVRDLYVAGFKGHGFAIIGTGGTPLSDPTHGEPNLTRGDRCYADGNAGHGFYAFGGDSNQGTWIACSAISNGAWGFYDSSFLGNVWIGCHARGNGGAAVDEADGTPGLATTGGLPGGYCFGPSNGGANVTTAAGFANYAESDAEVFLAQDASYIIRMGSATFTGPGSWLTPSGGGEVANAWAMPAAVFDFKDGAGNDCHLGLNPQGAEFRALELARASLHDIRLVIDATHSAWKLQSNDELLRIYPNVTGALMGAVGVLSFPFGFKVGNNEVDWGYSTGAPGSGAHARGEIAYENAPTPGGFIGYVCTTAGTPGTWKGFGAIAP